MTDYSSLSAHARDVLLAVGVELSQRDETVAGPALKQRVSEIRDEPQKLYTNEVISELVTDGWLERTVDDDDARVARYRLTTNGQTALTDRKAVFDDLDSGADMASSSSGFRTATVGDRP